jgi:hypothetical protein
LSFFLIVPEIGVGYLFFELLQLGSLRFRVKETSAIRLLGVLNPHSVRAIPARQMYRPSTIFLLRKQFSVFSFQFSVGNLATTEN